MTPLQLAPATCLKSAQKDCLQNDTVIKLSGLRGECVAGLRQDTLKVDPNLDASN